MPSATISDSMEKIIKEQEKNFTKSEEYIKLYEFEIKMSKRGIARKKEYDLPPIDTLGKRFFASN
jgi:hypothetical protein